MFKSIRQVLFNLLLIFIVEDLIRAVAKRLRRRQLPGELV